MKVYLDEPTQRVGIDGINYTNYIGHFYEEEFMITPSEGFEVTGLPLMYPYWNGIPSSSTTVTIDVENHYYSKINTNLTNSINVADDPLSVSLRDSQDPNDTSGNAVLYTFTRFGWEEPGSEEPGLTPITDPGSEVGPIS